ncbi:hypothetical protein DY000_02015175 [Brassica cretica]|uniref:Integrase zinc-binding domain-containing protein n=1 Tax=Brassica cretica TaxID=69181 RepID=A0ABQ7CSM7_BRACR|nr:hypothetical protein DY000_02015175 [Brassica cretica]
MEEPPSEEVSAVKEGETWMTPLIRYLEADILPEDHSEARKIKKQAARYCISQEKRYRRSFSGPYLRCVTPREAARILVELHEGDCGSHFSGRSLVLRARRAGTDVVPDLKRKELLDINVGLLQIRQTS